MKLLSSLAFLFTVETAPAQTKKRDVAPELPADLKGKPTSNPAMVKRLPSNGTLILSVTAT